jgi:hypothetical protein
MRLSRAGQLRRVLFRTEPVFVELMFEGGGTRTYRIVPETMAHGMLIGHVPRDAAESSQFFQGVMPQRVARFRVVGPGAASYENRIAIAWEERDRLPRVGIEPA